MTICNTCENHKVFYDKRTAVTCVCRANVKGHATICLQQLHKYCYNYKEKAMKEYTTHIVAIFYKDTEIGNSFYMKLADEPEMCKFEFDGSWNILHILDAAEELIDNAVDFSKKPVSLEEAQDLWPDALTFIAVRMEAYED